MKMPSTGMRPTAIDLFSGCGGFSMGVRRAGFEILAALEFEQLAADTYELNKLSTQVIREDIRNVSPLRVRRMLGIDRGTLDLLVGGPPCQGFSSMTTRNRANSVEDERNELVLQMSRFARSLRPKVIAIENVPASHSHRSFRHALTDLESMGYVLNVQVVDFQHYGVAQRRRRLLVLGGLGWAPSLPPQARLRRSVRDLISGLPPAGHSGDLLHDFPEQRSPEVREKIKRIPKDGGSRHDLPENHVLACHRDFDGHKDTYGRLSWDDVSSTITTGCYNPSKGRFLHPTKHRCITMREAALLQSFPLSFRVPSWVAKTQAARMIGNAIPPEFAWRLGRSLRTQLATQKLL